MRTVYWINIFIVLCGNNIFFHGSFCLEGLKMLGMLKNLIKPKQMAIDEKYRCQPNKFT